MAKKKSSRVVVGARLLHVVDNYLRKKQRGRGDMSSLIYEALREVDLGSVDLITIQGERRQVTARPTKIVLPPDMRDELQQFAESRDCSMNELMNSALVAALLKSRTQKSGERSRRGHTAMLNTMTAKEREQFFARLLALTGLEPGHNYIGYVTFEVPEGVAAMLVLVYKPSFLSTTYEIPLF